MLQKKWKSLAGFFYIFLFLALTTIPADALPNVSITFNVSQTLEDVYVLTGYPNGSPTNGIGGSIYQTFIGEVPSGIHTYFFYTPLVSTSTYTILGLYDSINNGVTVALQNVPLGTSWNDYFHPELITSHDFTETSVANHLKTIDPNSPYWLEDFYAKYYRVAPTFIGGPIGTSVLLANFTDATIGGSAYATAVSAPEPATMLLLGLGLIGLAGVRRKFKK